MKKMYCLVVINDYSEFTWVFFLATKVETIGILKFFIVGIKNLVDHKVKVIRCENGTEYKNREMNQFCKMKGILRQFSVARTPQQNGFVERRNMTLMAATSTMLDDSKLPTTFWAEAINTACYVQNKVLVVKPHNKTPYKLFHGRTPTLSFIRPFRCHVTILNTIDHLGKFDVDAGTNSTNLSGTKDAANQEVKKDVSSLRYIVLHNWAHDALLESSSSKPHDESSSQVPKGSGNPNPTASSSNPLADQIETLTVESPIPTVSSPVLTACLNDSSKCFSEARLISKRVANQEETTSLDNILSLRNRFEDILGVSTSSSETIRVEADVSNMETTISASPTPTLRIHKDHPKSQIIGHVDTPIQTRHKSKMVEEQSFIATIH
nr:putative ribonuclease H-like domain-containing protein [Tanacetum cinerariifolium]